MGNLIERLGGYSEALYLFKGCPWENGIVDVPNPRSKGMLRLDLSNLAYELLEYRRQHNIYEVEDLVTYKAYFKGAWREGFGKITVIDEGLEVVNIDDNIGVSISEIEHATNEEIKVGRRL